MRWQAVLTALRSHLGRLINHYLAGQFVSNVLPTTIGGDVLRVAGCPGRTASRRRRPRLGGARAAHRLARPAGAHLRRLRRQPRAHPPRHRHGWPSPWPPAPCCSCSSCWCWWPPTASAAGSAAAEGWRRFAGAVHLGLDRLRRHPAAAANVLPSASPTSSAWCWPPCSPPRPSAWASRSGLTALLAFFPAVAIAQVLPIGISGLGVREGAFALFLAPLGVAHRAGGRARPPPLPAQPRRQPARAPRPAFGAVGGTRRNRANPA